MAEINVSAGGTGVDRSLLLSTLNTLVKQITDIITEAKGHVSGKSGSVQFSCENIWLMNLPASKIILHRVNYRWGVKKVFS